MKRNSVTILDERNTLKTELRSLIETAREEKRELTEQEEGRIEEIKKEIKNLEDELTELESKRDADPDPDKENENKENQRSMKKNFSILSAIRSVVDNKNFDPITSAMIQAGKEEMRGMSISGQIQLPVEQRTITVTGQNGEHDDVVSTDLYNVLEPLQNRLVLAQAGARFLTGLVGDVQFPIMSNGNVAWEGEVTEADDLGTIFSSVKLQPKRLSATIEVSKQFIMQDSVGAENAIRNELVNAIAQKLESTILGDEVGSTTKPQGIFYSNDAGLQQITSFAELCALEADLEYDKIYDKVYVLSPHAKAHLRSMIKGTNNTGMIMENGEVDGTPAYFTGMIPAEAGAVGDFSQMVIGQWGGLDITVDPYTKAKNATIVLTINAWFDAKVLRPEAIRTFEIPTVDDGGEDGGEG
jgi:HK97 family phage major capsid protein